MASVTATGIPSQKEISYWHYQKGRFLLLGMRQVQHWVRNVEVRDDIPPEFCIRPKDTSYNRIRRIAVVLLFSFQPLLMQIIALLWLMFLTCKRFFLCNWYYHHGVKATDAAGNSTTCKCITSRWKLIHCQKIKYIADWKYCMKKEMPIFCMDEARTYNEGQYILKILKLNPGVWDPKLTTDTGAFLCARGHQWTTFPISRCAIFWSRRSLCVASRNGFSYWWAKIW